jgi:hypothetical protein
MPTGFDSAWVSRQPGAGDTERRRALTGLGGLADPSRLNTRVGRSISTAVCRSARILGRNTDHYPAVPALAPFRSRPKPGLIPTPLSGHTAAPGVQRQHPVRLRPVTSAAVGTPTGSRAPRRVCSPALQRPAPRRLPHGLTRCQRRHSGLLVRRNPRFLEAAADQPCNSPMLRPQKEKEPH